MTDNDAAQAKRAADMPTEQDAIKAMWSAYHRLEELGWRDAIYCPKDAVTREDTGCIGIAGATSANVVTTSSTSVTGDALRDALAAAQSEIQYCHDELKGVTSHEIGYGGMTYKQLETLINHAIKGRSK